jgi:CBS domain-containing protein
MRATDVMTSRVISVRPDASILEAMRLMLQHRISGLPVIDASGTLVGLVTEGDFLRRAETGTNRHRSRWLEFLIGPGRLAEEYTHTHGRKVEEVMTADPITVTEDTAVADIVPLMERRRIKRVPVVRGKEVVGIVTRANLLHALVGLARGTKPNNAADWAIRDQISAVLKKETWAPFATIDVTVRRGVVDLWGVIFDERERRALIVASENVPGVKPVNDHLAWVESNSDIVVENESASETKQA